MLPRQPLRDRRKHLPRDRLCDRRKHLLRQRRQELLGRGSALALEVLADRDLDDLASGGPPGPWRVRGAVPDLVNRRVQRRELLGQALAFGCRVATDGGLRHGPAFDLGVGPQRGVNDPARLREQLVAEASQLVGRGGGHVDRSRRRLRRGRARLGGPRRAAHRGGQRLHQSRRRPRIHLHRAVHLRALGHRPALVEEEHHRKLPELRRALDGARDVGAGHTSRLQLRVDQDEVDVRVADDAERLKAGLDDGQLPALMFAEGLEHGTGGRHRVRHENPRRMRGGFRRDRSDRRRAGRRRRNDPRRFVDRLRGRYPAVGGDAYRLAHGGEDAGRPGGGDLDRPVHGNPLGGGHALVQHEHDGQGAELATGLDRLGDLFA